jgi:hypothetical protein
MGEHRTSVTVAMIGATATVAAALIAATLSAAGKDSPSAAGEKEPDSTLSVASPSTSTQLEAATPTPVDSKSAAGESESLSPFIGTWEGSTETGNPPVTTDIVVDIDPGRSRLIGTTSYFKYYTLACKASLSVKLVKEDVADLFEHEIAGECQDRVETLQKIDDDHLRISWITKDDESTRTVEETLTRQDE